MPDRVFDSRDFGSGVDVDKLPCTINTTLAWDVRVDFGVEKMHRLHGEHGSNLTTRLFQLSHCGLTILMRPDNILSTRDQRARARPVLIEPFSRECEL